MVVTRTPVRVLKLSTFVNLVLNKFLFKLNNKDSKVIVYANDVEMFIIKGEFFFTVILRMKYKVNLFRVNHLDDICLFRLIQNNVQITYFFSIFCSKKFTLKPTSRLYWIFLLLVITLIQSLLAKELEILKVRHFFRGRIIYSCGVKMLRNCLFHIHCIVNATQKRNIITSS